MFMRFGEKVDLGDEVAHALVRAVSRLLSTPCWGTNSLSGPGVGMSADAARTSACATSSLPNSPNIVQFSGTGHRLSWPVAEGLRPAKFHEKVGEPGCRRAGWAAPEAG